MSQQLGNIHAIGNTRTQSYDNKKSILDYKSIQDHPTIGDNRSDFIEWSHKLKNKFKGIYGTDKSWEIWIDKAEFNMKDPTQIRNKGNAENTLYDGAYDLVSDMLIQVLTDKLSAGSIPYMKVKRSRDGLQAWAEIYRYYREISGQGLLSKELGLLQPRKAKDDAEVVGLNIEKWEDEYKEC